MRNTFTPALLYILAARRGSAVNRRRGDCADMRFLYPKGSPRHPSLYPFNSPRSELYEKCPLFNHDGSSVLRSAGPCCKLLGAEPPANSRTDCQNLRDRFVWTN